MISNRLTCTKGNSEMFMKKMVTATTDALGTACFAAMHVGAVGSGELVMICLFFSLRGLSPPIAVIL